MFQINEGAVDVIVRITDDATQMMGTNNNCLVEPTSGSIRTMITINMNVQMKQNIQQC